VGFLRWDFLGFFAWVFWVGFFIANPAWYLGMRISGGISQLSSFSSSSVRFTCRGKFFFSSLNAKISEFLNFFCPENSGAYFLYQYITVEAVPK
jgi:hypothetical protein